MKWGVQCFSDWRDYDHWDDIDYAYDWKEPLRFDSKEDADVWIMNRAINEFVKEFDAWERTLSRKWLSDELYRMRKQALVDAGLWDHPFTINNQMRPLVGMAHGYQKPRFKINQYRSVPDNEMDNPTMRYPDTDDFDWKYSAWNKE